MRLAEVVLFARGVAGAVMGAGLRVEALYILMVRRGCWCATVHVEGGQRRGLPRGLCRVICPRVALL